MNVPDMPSLSSETRYPRFVQEGDEVWLRVFDEETKVDHTICKVSVPRALLLLKNLAECVFHLAPR